MNLEYDNIIDLTKVYINPPKNILLRQKYHIGIKSFYNFQSDEDKSDIDAMFKLIFDGYTVKDMWYKCAENRDIWNTENPVPKHFIGVTTFHDLARYLIVNRQPMTKEEKIEMTDKFLAIHNNRPKNYDVLDKMLRAIFNQKGYFDFVKQICTERKK